MIPLWIKEQMNSEAATPKRDDDATIESLDDMDKSKHAILLAAARAFMEQGFGGTSIDSVAEILNCTKGRIDYHFKSKSDLFIEVHRFGISGTLAALRPIAASGDRPRRRLERMCHAHIDAITNNLPLSKVAIQGVKLHLELSTTPAQRQKLRSVIAIHREIETMFFDIVNEGIQEGDFAPGSPRTIVRALLGSMNWMTIWYNERPGGSDSEINDEIVHFIMRGVTGS